MRTCCLMLLVAGLAVAQDNAKDELAKLQGAWYLADFEFDGKKAAWMDLTDAEGKIVVKGDKLETKLFGKGVAISFSFEKVGEKKEPLRPVLKQIRTNRDQIKVENGDKATSISFKVDPAAKPRHIDGTFDRIEVPGIYALDGDVLKVCAGDPEAGRPKEFKANDKTALVTFVREKELKAREMARKQPMQGELKKLAGTWKVTEGRYDNAPLTEKDLKDFELVFKDDQLIWKEAGQSETLTVQLDPATLPERSINLVPGQGKPPVCGVYKVEGDRLIVRLPWNHLLHRTETLDANPKEFGFGGKSARLVLKKAAP